MDYSKILFALESSFSEIHETRIQAESYINQIKYVQGFPIALIELAFAQKNDREINEKVRQAALITLKNLICQYWTSQKSEIQNKNNNSINFQISLQDKQFIKENIFFLFSRSNVNTIRSIIENIILLICENDFILNWPELVPQIKTSMDTDFNLTQAESCLYASFSCIYIISKLFKFKSKEKRNPFNQILEEFIPKLLYLSKKLINFKPEDKICRLLLLIFKILHLSIFTEIPDPFKKGTCLGELIKVIAEIINIPFSSYIENGVGSDENISCEKYFYQGKLRRKIMYFLYFMFQKYMNYKYDQEIEQECQIYNQLSENFSLIFFEISLNLLKKFTYELSHPATQFYCLKIINQALKNQHVQTLLNSELIDSILTQHCFLITFLTNEEEELYLNEPNDFCLRMNDLFLGEDLREASQDLLQTACSLSQFISRKEINQCMKKESFYVNEILYHYLQFLSLKLNESTNSEIINTKIIDAVLFSFGALAEEIEKYEFLINDLYQLIEKYLIPFLSNKNGLIKMRTSWALSKFSPKQIQREELRIKLAKSLFQNLKQNEEEFPVRVSAGIALYPYFSFYEIKKLFEPNLSSLLDSYIDLIKQIDMEEILIAIERIVDEFKNKVLPFSIQLIHSLSSMFINNFTKEKSTLNKNLTFKSCISTITKIIQIMIRKKTFNQDIELMLFPIFSVTLQSSDEEIIYYSLEMIISYTYFTNSISDKLFNIFPLLINACIGSKAEANNASKQDVYLGYYHIKEIGLCIQNLISKAPERFCNEANASKPELNSNLNLIWNVINKINEIEENSGSKLGRITGIKLVISLFESMKGLSLPILKDLFLFLNNMISEQQSLEIKQMSIQAIIMGFYFSSEILLKVLEEFDFVQEFFKILYSFEDKFKYKFEIRRLLIGLSYLLKLQSFPSSLMPEINAIVQFSIRICYRLIILSHKYEINNNEDKECENLDYKDKFENINSNEIEDEEKDEDEDEGEYFDENEHKNEDKYNDQDEKILKLEKGNALEKMDDSDEHQQKDKIEDEQEYSSSCKCKSHPKFIKDSDKNCSRQNEVDKYSENPLSTDNKLSENAENYENLDDSDNFSKTSEFGMGGYKKEGADNKFYDSKLKEINEITLFINILNEIQIKNPQIFINLKETLTQEEIRKLYFCLNFSLNIKAH